jgi:hypothetical protein
MKVSGSEPVPTFGFEYAVGLEPIAVNLDRMIDKFRLGVKELMPIWEMFLPREAIKHLSRAATMQKEEFHIPDEVWVESVYSFALSAHRKLINTEHLLKSLTPLYIGRTASFVIENWNSDAPEVEERIEQLCSAYEETKSFLTRSWDAKQQRE